MHIGDTKFRRAQREVVVGDRLRSRHHAERELHGIEIPEAVDMLEPDQRDIGGVLGFFDLLAAALFIVLQPGGHGRRVPQRVGERDRIFHRELGSGPDREMRGRLGIAEQDHVVLDPALAADHRKVAPHRAVDQQRIAVEEPRKNLRHAIGGGLLAEAFEAGALKRLGVGFKDPGRMAGFILIGVGDEGPPLRLLKDEGEGIERLGRSHPGELVGAKIDLRLEMCLVFLA
jgi:hypothetical protein